MHSTPAGSGLHTPALVQVAVIIPSGDNPGLHWKVITDPSIVSILLKSSIIPFKGPAGTLQLTGT